MTIKQMSPTPTVYREKCYAQLTGDWCATLRSFLKHVIAGLRSVTVVTARAVSVPLALFGQDHEGREKTQSLTR
jgi:hypothetical protein